MKYIKKYGKGILSLIIFILIASLIISIFNYTHIFYSRASETCIFILMILFFSITGFIYGKKAPSKGYLEGLKVGAIFIFFLILINLLFFQNHFSLERILYYVVLILSSIFSSMIGINKKS